MASLDVAAAALLLLLDGTIPLPLGALRAVELSLRSSDPPVEVRFATGARPGAPPLPRAQTAQPPARPPLSAPARRSVHTQIRRRQPLAHPPAGALHALLLIDADEDGVPLGYVRVRYMRHNCSDERSHQCSCGDAAGARSTAPCPPACVPYAPLEPLTKSHH